MQLLVDKKKKSVVSASEIIRFVTHNSLHLYKRKGSRAPLNRLVAYENIEKKNPYNKGAIFVSPSKADLIQGKGYVVTSYETLKEKNLQLSHWTPNTYRGGTYYSFKNRVIKGHERENLKQINVIGFDIDTKELDLYNLYLACQELKLPRPNLLLETPRGFQGFFVLETPFFINKNSEYKSLRIAERLTSNIRKALSGFVPVDTNCVPFGFYRIPREDNILDFYDQPASTRQLITWSKKFEEREKRQSLRVVYDKNSPTFDQTSSEWYRALIHVTNIEKGHLNSSRNNALLTLALANYASGRSFKEAYDELDEFNSRLDRPLHRSEFRRTLKSAYSGKYNGVKRSYVEGLLELWTDGQVRFQGKEGWYKFKKDREKRIRSHYEEWEEDILSYLNDNTSPEMPFLEASLSTLAETLGIAVSSLKEVVKRSERLIKRTIGRGRGAVTKWANRTVLFKSLLQKRKQNQQVQMTLFSFLPQLHQLKNIKHTFANNEDSIYERVILYQNGFSPPIK